jgi:hypothetical protein
MVEDSLSEELLSGAIHIGERVLVSADGEQMKFTPAGEAAAQNAEAQDVSASSMIDAAR